MPRKAPEMPVGPNPHMDDPIHVARFGQAWAVVESLGVISAHKRWREAKAALAAILQQRAAIAASRCAPIPQSAVPVAAAAPVEESSHGR